MKLKSANRLLHLADFLETLPQDAFKERSPLDWAATIPEFKRAGLQAKKARAFFGLTEREAKEMFTSFPPRGGGLPWFMFEPKHVATDIRAFVKVGIHVGAAERAGMSLHDWVMAQPLEYWDNKEPDLRLAV